MKMNDWNWLETGSQAKQFSQKYRLRNHRGLVAIYSNGGDGGGGGGGDEQRRHGEQSFVTQLCQRHHV